MASLLLRSAAGRVLPCVFAKSFPQGSFLRSPVRMLSDGVGRFESKHCCRHCKLTKDPCQMSPHSYFLELQKQNRIASENGERFERRKILLSCFFVPVIFYLGLGKKEKLSERQPNL